MNSAQAKTLSTSSVSSTHSPSSVSSTHSPNSVSSTHSTCQNCKNQFTIESEDFDFYSKIQVPPPTWCPDCRNLRRMLWREERTLYRSACGLCGKAIITVHSPDGPFTVYCRECYKSDKWDPLTYGRDYDFNKPFFLQYRAYGVWKHRKLRFFHNCRKRMTWNLKTAKIILY